MAEESSEEEWTYTSSRANDVSEQRETNVLVRLDFGESRSSDNALENMKTAEGTVRETVLGVANVEETSNETDASSRREKDSDDETKNDKTSIQRLIKEVEKLVGEERRTGACKTFPPLILDDKGITNNHRAKYARIKEWLKLNSARGHDGRSTSQVGCNYCYCSMLSFYSVTMWDYFCISFFNFISSRAQAISCKSEDEVA